MIRRAKLFFNRYVIKICTGRYKTNVTELRHICYHKTQLVKIVFRQRDRNINNETAIFKYFSQPFKKYQMKPYKNAWPSNAQFMCRSGRTLDTEKLLAADRNVREKAVMFARLDLCTQKNAEGFSKMKKGKSL